MLEGSVSINGRELETMLAFKSPTEDVENDLFDKPVSRKSRENYDDFSGSFSNLSEKGLYSPALREPLRHRDLAALKLQKVYKSFRTRRQLADCAVLAEQRWLVSFNISYLQVLSLYFISLEPLKSPSNYNIGVQNHVYITRLITFICNNRWRALDFAELKRSSISFFDIEKPETAVSRWSRARRRAAKVIFLI